MGVTTAPRATTLDRCPSCDRKTRNATPPAIYMGKLFTIARRRGIIIRASAHGRRLPFSRSRLPNNCGLFLIYARTLFEIASNTRGVYFEMFVTTRRRDLAISRTTRGHAYVRTRARKIAISWRRVFRITRARPLSEIDSRDAEMQHLRHCMRSRSCVFC